jgi:aspartyl-tRNA(Asn)/glutamyl-tRNA(Gln) amidotransferase subunit A
MIKDKFNAFIEINEKVKGFSVGVKSNICVKGMLTTCASKTLENYRAPYDADVITKIKEKGWSIAGMCNMDEFASGSSGETSYFKPTKNPAALGRVPGGSSSGSAVAVAAGYCDVALGSDTGGSIRNPASHCGVIGIKPSYGRVSRFGLIDLSMSLDQIGVFSKNVLDAAKVMNVISGYSENDPTTFDEKVPDYTKFKKINGLRVGICEEFMDLCFDKKIKKLIEDKIEILKEKYGLEIVKINLKHINLAVQTYYPIVYTEFFSGTRKFDGRKYGFKIEDVCGEEVLRRILGGSEISKAEYKGTYYRRALNAKEIIGKELKEAFKKVDVILSPAVPKLPHKIGENISIEEMYAYDAFTIPANLAGICAGVINAGKVDDVPVGLQVMCDSFKEEILFNFLKGVEDLG